ncbi:phage major capsid protein [Mesorhizobium sp. LSHC412B00]|uniref:phage major capsid protein n=1 Tax=Mesorhizobium sp. LSHC412B00 TaxID=1287285 RepID=UPI0035939F53
MSRPASSRSCSATGPAIVLSIAPTSASCPTPTRGRRTASSGYRIVDRTDFSILSDPYTRAKNGIVVLHSRKRVGGDVTNPDRFAKLKISA